MLLQLALVIPLEIRAADIKEHRILTQELAAGPLIVPRVQKAEVDTCWLLS